ncbi:hypothetical protein ACQP0C_03950 [Nocardia sp. CA-129566]|uniref:hypothetical protein n=1 Tax=Nocardia sp. CA-129566 TaxID=3239976 RepID=UPI003D98FAD9
MHEPAVQFYSAPAWLQFLRLFLPHYLHHGTHPYHHHADEVIVRQNSRIVAAPALAPRVCAVIHAPIGLFRKAQRHYITLRDHVWRSGILGFTPVLDGQLAGDWIDFRTGHKRVHFAFADSAWMSTNDRADVQAVSESYGDYWRSVVFGPAGFPDAGQGPQPLGHGSSLWLVLGRRGDRQLRIL